MNEALNEAGNSPAPAQGELVETIGISRPVADAEPEGANNTEAQTEAEEETGEQAEPEEAEEEVKEEPEKPKGNEFRLRGLRNSKRTSRKKARHSKIGRR